MRRREASKHAFDKYDGWAKEPPDAGYRKLAVAESDTTPAYIDAGRVSLERYKGAEVAGDTLWMARHMSAMRQYEKRLADSRRRDADELEKTAKQFPADNPVTIAKLQADRDELLNRLRRGESLRPDEVGKLRAAGLADTETKALFRSGMM